MTEANNGRKRDTRWSEELTWVYAQVSLKWKQVLITEKYKQMDTVYSETRKCELATEIQAKEKASFYHYEWQQFSPSDEKQDFRE